MKHFIELNFYQLSFSLYLFEGFGKVIKLLMEGNHYSLSLIISHVCYKFGIRDFGLAVIVIWPILQDLQIHKSKL